MDAMVTLPNQNKDCNRKKIIVIFLKNIKWCRVIVTDLVKPLHLNIAAYRIVSYFKDQIDKLFDKN